MIKSGILAQKMNLGVREKDREEFKKQKKRQKLFKHHSRVSISFFDQPFSLNLSDHQSLDQFQEFCNEINKITVNDRQFKQIIENTICSMNNQSTLQNGIKMFLLIFPKMNQSQNEILQTSIFPDTLQKWINLSPRSCMQLVYYLCVQQQKIEWKNRIYKYHIRKLFFFVINQSANYYQNMFIDLLISLMKCEWFSQQCLCFLEVILPKWIQNIFDQTINLIKAIVDKQFSKTINNLQGRFNLFNLIFEDGRYDSQRLKVKYISLMNQETVSLSWTESNSLEHTFQLFEQINIEDSLDNLEKFQRIQFYSLINNLSKEFEREQQRGQDILQQLIYAKQMIIAYLQRRQQIEGKDVEDEIRLIDE